MYKDGLKTKIQQMSCIKHAWRNQLQGVPGQANALSPPRFPALPKTDYSRYGFTNSDLTTCPHWPLTPKCVHVSLGG